MDPIDPIHAYGAENPAMLHWLAEQEEIRRQQAAGKTSGVGASQVYRSHIIQPDNPRPWAMDRMNYILMYARRAFWLGQYDSAIKHYGDFFNYVRHYGTKLGSLSQLWSIYLPVMYEMNWALMRQGQVKETERLYNEALEQILQEMKKNKPAPVRDMITELQQEEKLPVAHEPDRPVDVPSLEQLARQLSASGAREEAGLMLDFAQLKLGMEQLRMAEMEQALALRDKAKTKAPEPRVLPRLVVPQWLHYAPTQGFVPFNPQLFENAFELDHLPPAPADMVAQVEMDLNGQGDHSSRDDRTQKFQKKGRTKQDKG